ncbi:MAG: peptide deformylase [Acidobacteria bacterium]|nr:MAG: peptide deformylase [Acidobacteriota bacterium]
MAVRDIVLFPEEVLATRGERVEEITAEIRELVADMVETMYAAPGVGLAAQQVGEALQLAVVDVSVGEEPDQLLVLINPEIIAQEGSQVDEEGCLSFPGITEMVERPMKVTLRAQDLEGEEFEVEGEGFLARAFCHEIDHLNGVLFIERMSSLKRQLVRRKIRKAVRAGEWSEDRP